MIESGCMKAPKNEKMKWPFLTLSRIEPSLNVSANRIDSDQAAAIRAAWSGSTPFALRNIIDQSLMQTACNNKTLGSMYQNRK